MTSPHARSLRSAENIHSSWRGAFSQLILVDAGEGFELDVPRYQCGVSEQRWSWIPRSSRGAVAEYGIDKAGDEGAVSGQRSGADGLVRNLISPPPGI